MRTRLDVRHPSTRRLQQWLDTGDPARVAAHVAECERCADRLERLDRDEPESAGSALHQALSAVLRPPDDLGERVLYGIEARRRLDDELRLIAGLFTIGVETAQLMFATGTDEDRPVDSRADGDADVVGDGDRDTDDEEIDGP